MCHLGVKKEVKVERWLFLLPFIYYRLEVRVLCWDVKYRFNAPFSS